MLATLVDPDLEIVVVNMEDDPEVDDVVTRSGAGARCVSVHGNPGYAAGVNRGVREATAPVVVFMNDDLVVDAKTVLSLAAALDDGVGVAVPALRTQDG